MTKAEKIAKSEEQQKIFDLACALSHNINNALQHGAKYECLGRRETYADGVYNACWMMLEKLYAIYGEKYFYPSWLDSENGEKVLVIFAGTLPRVVE